MSNAMLTAVFDRSRTRNGARLVMLALADRANESGRAWPSISDLMRRTALSRGAIHAALKQAQRLGELEVSLFSGPRLCNVYKIKPPTRSDSVPHSDSEPVRILNGTIQIPDKTHSDSEPKPSLTLKNPQSFDRARVKAKPKPDDDPAFATFWQAYPRKTAKAQAAKAWRATDRHRPSMNELLAALERHKGSRQWADAQYIPHPATWLNGHRWGDELKSSEPAIPQGIRVRL